MKPYSRRWLQVTNQGKWYVAFTIILGVVAISSGNNVLYLLESLLLGGLALSGVFSEKTVAGVEIAWKRRPVIAGEAVGDLLQVTNRMRIPIFCLEIGEWRSGKLETRAFIPFLGARQSKTVFASTPYTTRGEWKWDGVSTATLYPFGFAKKIKWTMEPGSRVVWPARPSSHSQQWIQYRSGSTQERSTSQRMLNQGHSGSKNGPGEYSEGEVRPLQVGDDYRDVVWTLSLKRGEPVVRPRHQLEDAGEVILDLRQEGGKEFEEALSQAADVFYRMGDGTLIFLDWDGKKRFEGAKASLDALGLARPSGKARAQQKGKVA